MSYCRFSCDDYQSDVYCYAHVHGGFRIEIARSRLVLGKPLPPPVDISDTEAWLDRHNEVMAIIRDAGREPIGLPKDGESIHVETAEEAVEELEGLRELGYRVPQHAIDDLRECVNEN